MANTLENLSEILYRQFEEMVYTPTLNNSQTIIIYNLAVSIIVDMKREMIEHSGPICAGKLCKDTAIVLISPENSIVENVVAEHFKNNKVHMLMGPMRHQFDKVVINGQDLKM